MSGRSGGGLFLKADGNTTWLSELVPDLLQRLTEGLWKEEDKIHSGDTSGSTIHVEHLCITSRVSSDGGEAERIRQTGSYSPRQTLDARGEEFPQHRPGDGVESCSRRTLKIKNSR